MWELGITLDHLPSPSYEENKVTYHCRPGLDQSAKMMFMALATVRIRENDLLKPLSPLNV